MTIRKVYKRIIQIIKKIFNIFKIMSSKMEQFIQANGKMEKEMVKE